MSKIKMKKGCAMNTSPLFHLGCGIHSDFAVSYLTSQNGFDYPNIIDLTQYDTMDTNIVYCYYNGTPLTLPKEMWAACKKKGESDEYCATEHLDLYKAQLDEMEARLTKLCGKQDIGDQEARLRVLYPERAPKLVLVTWVLNIAALIKAKRLKDDEQNGWLYKIERGPNEIQMVVGADTTPEERMRMLMAGFSNRRVRRARR